MSNIIILLTNENFSLLNFSSIWKWEIKYNTSDDSIYMFINFKLQEKKHSDVQHISKIKCNNFLFKKKVLYKKR